MIDIGGPYVKHWLVQGSCLGPEDHARLNDWLEKSTARLAELLEERDWLGVMATYQRAWRMDRFEHLAVTSKHAARMTDEEYWRTLSFVITDQEDCYRQRAALNRLLIKTKRSKSLRHLLMTEEDRAALTAMPEDLIVYRGCQEFNKLGWSWTIDRERAEWFSKRRYKGKPILLTGAVRKSDVIAFFSDRGESEILIPPKHVKLVAEYRVEAA